MDTWIRLGVITWRSAGLSLTGEFPPKGSVFLSVGLDPNVKNMCTRCLWLTLASSGLSSGMIEKRKNNNNLGPEAAMLGHWLGKIRAYDTRVNKIEEEYVSLEFSIAGDGTQHLVLPGDPSAGGSHSGQWPFPDESVEF